MDALPNELLLDILENLDYWDLTLRIPFVCHRFRNLIINHNGRNLKRLLFKEDYPHQDVTPDYKPGSVMNFLWPDLDEVPCPEGFRFIAKRFYLSTRRIDDVGGFSGKVHPAFSLIEYTPGDLLEDVNIRFIPAEKGAGNSVPGNITPLSRTPPVAQNATSPAVSQLVLHVSHFGEALISGKPTPSGPHAVSLEQVIQGMIDLHYAEMSKEELQHLWEAMNQEDHLTRKTTVPREIFSTHAGKYYFPGIETAMMIDGILHFFVTDGYGHP